MLELFLNLIDSEEDKTKFEIIYRRYRGFMLKVARMYTDSDYDAEDALQNAFLSIIHNMDNIKTDKEEMLKSYLKTVVKHAAIDWVRKKARTAFVDIESVEIKHEELTEQIEELEIKNELIRSVCSIPHIYKSVATLNILHNYSPKEISILLGIPVNTVNTRLRRGRKMIERKMREHYGKD